MPERKNRFLSVSASHSVCAVTGQSLPSDPMAGEVLMKVGEMERFRHAAEDRISTGRAVESMKSHKWFPGYSAL